MIKMYFDNIMLLVEVVLGLKNARVHSSFCLRNFDTFLDFAPN